MLAVLLLSGYGFAEDSITPESLRSAEQLLTGAIHEEGEWSSIHAAEYLILAGRKGVVREAFAPQANASQPAYRIGVWRVLAQAEDSPELHSRFVERIRAALQDAASPDRLHALESLAKLHVPITNEDERELVSQIAEDAQEPGQAFAVWRLEQKESRPERLTVLVEALRSDDPIRRLRAGFVLGQLRSPREEVQQAIAAALEQEPRDSVAYPYLAIAAGDPALTALAERQEIPEAQALAVREMVLRGLSPPRIETNPQTPLSLRMAITFARLMKQLPR